MASVVAPDEHPGRSNRSNPRAAPGLRGGSGRRSRSVRVARRMLLLFCMLTGPMLGGEIARAQQPAPEAVPSVPAATVPSAVAQFTTGVVDREPTDQVTFVSNDVRKIYFFSDLRGLTGETVTHRWVYKGEVIAEVRFEVRGPRWRVWSSKDLIEDWVGDWTVEIVRGNGEVLAAETFTYSAPGA